eukprot:4178912-Alexandrium_andersonii.AAC.1
MGDGDVESQPGPTWRPQGRNRRADHLLPNNHDTGDGPMGQFVDVTEAILVCLVGLHDALTELEQAQGEVNQART